MKPSLTLLLFLMVAFISAFTEKRSLAKYFGVNLIKNPGAEEMIVEQKIPNWPLKTDTQGRDTVHGTYGEKEEKGRKGVMIIAVFFRILASLILGFQ